MLGITTLASFIAANACAGTYYVDGADYNASDSGPGSSSQPFKTIQAAVSHRGLPGNTVLVRPGIYRELVSMSRAHAGTPGNPFVLRAAGPGVAVLGSDDFSGAERWSRSSGNVYLAPGVTWAPAQVFADGARLTPSGASPSSLPAHAFTWVSGAGLYVNLGGDNPGVHLLEVGRRTHSISVSGNWMVLDGFAMAQTEDHALEVQSDSSVIVQNCTVSFANKHGIDVDGCTGVLLERNESSDNQDHGIYLNACVRCTLRGNSSARNARPAERAASGLDLNGSTLCVVEDNRCHDNQDTGIEFLNGSNNCLSRNNLSWNNGDHGYDHLNSAGVRHVGDVASGNFKDGFSFEGLSSRCSVYDCIAVENGLEAQEFDLWVDSTSVNAFTSDYNIFWNSTSQAPVRVVLTRYGEVADYSRATGRDAHSIQSEPRFVDGPHGDFHLESGSPAIDDAITSVADWPDSDGDGGARRDDPSTPNTGAGPILFADRGAFEFTPPEGAPPNLVANPGFENDLGGWGNNGVATLSRVAPGHGGGYCAQATSAGSVSFGITDKPKLIQNVAAPGITYHLTAWVRSPGSRGTGRIKVREYSGQERQGDPAYSSPVTLSPDWQQIAFDYVTRAAGSYLDVDVNDYPVSSGETIQIDDIAMFEVASVSARAVSRQETASSEARRFEAFATPNPVRGAGRLSFVTTRPGAVVVQVFDLAGRRVSEPLRATFLPAGPHDVLLGARGRASGLGAGAYFYRVVAAEGVKIGKFIVME